MCNLCEKYCSILASIENSIAENHPSKKKRYTAQDKTKRTKVKFLIRNAKVKDPMLSIMYDFSTYMVIVFMTRVANGSRQ